MITINQAKQWYPVADAVHGFEHILRVYHLATRLAIAEGADIEIVQAAVLLHDAHGSAGNGTDAHSRANHHFASADFAEEVLSADGWSPDKIAAVKHCIASHRFRDNLNQPKSIEAKVLFDADKLDSIGAIGAARAIAYAAAAQMPFYHPISKRFEEEGEVESGEPHSAYHEHVFKLRHIKSRMFTYTGRQIAEERHAFLNQFFETLEAECKGLK